jgi:predicted alpha/beta-fold hydrolase
VFAVWWHDQRIKLGLSKHVAFERETVLHADGGATALDWAGSLAHRSALARDTPIVIFLHSICANEDDDYGLTEWLNHAERDGWRPVVHVRRGHGGVKLRTPRFSALGNEGDLTDALAAIRDTFPDAAVVAVGLSAGTGPLLTHVGRAAARAMPRDGAATSSPLVAAVAVSAGYHVPIAFDRCTALFQPIMLAKIKGMFTRSPNTATPAHAGVSRTTALTNSLVVCYRSDDELDLLTRHDRVALEELRNATTMRAFHDGVAKLLGVRR